MLKLIVDKLSRIVKNKARLEKLLKVKITNRGREVFIEGLPEDEYDAERIIEALNFGFPFSTTLLIKDEEFLFEILNIKDHTKRKDLRTIRARIIGKEGKTLRTLNNITNCHFEILDKEIGIIGDAENIEAGRQAIISLIQGAKQANVYAYLEKHHPLPIFDLGLKEGKDKL